MKITSDTKVRLEFKLEDCWIGAYWKRSKDQLDIWICVIPCFPIHVTKERGKP